jgi:deazaflavin-dependent oxidoreductase (nitroreductase family)
MSTSQKSEPFDEPPRELIPARTREHIAAMEVSDADEVWYLAGMHHLMLCSVGRRSGKQQKAALPYWIDAAGHAIVVASYAGSPQHPAWYLNLQDRAKNPEVLVRTQREAYWAQVQDLDGDDYRHTWDALVLDRPFYVDYQSRTPRKLPLIRLLRRRPA